MTNTTSTIMRTDTMKHGFSCLMWTLVLLLLLAGVDQLLVRLPASLPAHVAVASFYRDLRSRVVDLVKGPPPAPGKPAGAPPKAAPPAKEKSAPASAPRSIEAVIEPHRARPAVQTPAPPSAPARPAVKPQGATPVPRYVYADDRGELHFAETLAEIPEAFRDKAKALGE